MCVGSTSQGGGGGGYGRSSSRPQDSILLPPPKTATDVAPAATFRMRGGIFDPLSDLERQRRPLNPLGLQNSPRLGL